MSELLLQVFFYEIDILTENLIYTYTPNEFDLWMLNQVNPLGFFMYSGAHWHISNICLNACYVWNGFVYPKIDLYHIQLFFFENQSLKQ